MPHESRAIDTNTNTRKEARKKKICLTGCRYDVVGRVALELGFKCVQEYDLWDIIWSDAPLPNERVTEMRRIQNLGTTGAVNIPSMQKMNHFPGMYEICRKDRLGRNLNKYKRVFSYDYNFFPLTWDLPTDLAAVTDYARKNKGMTFIIKPDSGCQGRGIFLIKNLKVLSPFAKCVAQQYMSQPFLVDGYKYDQRIYVLITCVDPLRIYLYEEGIARFATVKYNIPNEENLDIIFMHLTNYSLNKFSESYDPQREGSKRKLSAVYKWMEDHNFDTKQLRRDIDDIIIKTVICAARTLKHNYKTSFPKENRGCSCFELLGFDILVDRHLNPILLEVNHSPSFNLDLEVDNIVKTQLLRDVFKMVHVEKKHEYTYINGEEIPPPSRRGMRGIPPSCFEEIWPALQQQFVHEMSNLGGFRLIFSEENSGKYAKFLDKDIVFGYSDWSDETFLKPRPEVVTIPSPRDREPWSQDYAPESSLKVTKAGQVYVETTHPSAGPVTTQEYMKFKYTAPTRTKKKKDSVMSAESGESNTHEGKTTHGDGNPGITTEEDRKDSSASEKPAEIDKRTPSERVKAAIEKLRWKGMSKFKFIREPDEDVIKCRPHSGSSQSKESDNTEVEDSSDYPKNHYEKEIGTFSRPASARLSESRQPSPYLPNIETPKADISHLPTAMKDFINNNTKDRKSRTDKDYVKKWVASELKKIPSGEARSQLQTSSFPSFTKESNSTSSKDKRHSDVFVNNWIKSLKQQLPTDSSSTVGKGMKILNSGHIEIFKSNVSTERSSRQRKIKQIL